MKMKKWYVETNNTHYEFSEWKKAVSFFKNCSSTSFLYRSNGTLLDCK